MICNINISKFREALDNFQVRDEELALEMGDEQSLTINAGGHEFQVQLITFKVDAGHLTMGNGNWAEFMMSAFKTVAEHRKKKQLEKN